MWHLLHSVELPHIVEGVDGGREASVEREDFAFDEGCERQIIKEVCEIFPDGGVAVFPQTLVVEAVDLGDLSGLVVASENGDSVSVANLHAHQKSHSFHGIVAAVDVVAHEEVVGVWRDAANFEEFHEVVELAVDVAADGDGAADGLHIRFVLEDFLSLGRSENWGTFSQRTLTSNSERGLQFMSSSICLSMVLISSKVGGIVA